MGIFGAFNGTFDPLHLAVAIMLMAALGAVVLVYEERFALGTGAFGVAFLAACSVLSQEANELDVYLYDPTYSDAWRQINGLEPLSTTPSWVSTMTMVFGYAGFVLLLASIIGVAFGSWIMEQVGNARFLWFTRGAKVRYLLAKLRIRKSKISTEDIKAAASRPVEGVGQRIGGEFPGYLPQPSPEQPNKD